MHRDFLLSKGTAFSLGSSIVTVKDGDGDGTYTDNQCAGDLSRDLFFT